MWNCNLADAIYLAWIINTLVYLAPPRIQLAPGPTHAKVGQNIRLPKCHVTGFPAPAVIWRKLTSYLPRNRAVFHTGSLTIQATLSSDSGPYECIARNRLGQASKITTLFVWSRPTFTTKPPSVVTKVLGEDLSLDCTSTNQASVSWRRTRGAWEKRRMKVENGTLKISSLRMSDFGDYICEAKLLTFYSIQAKTTLDLGRNNDVKVAKNCWLNEWYLYLCVNTRLYFLLKYLVRLTVFSSVGRWFRFGTKSPFSVYSLRCKYFLIARFLKWLPYLIKPSSCLFCLSFLFSFLYLLVSLAPNQMAISK